MKLENGNYTVLSNVEMTPPLDQYDVVHNTENIDTNDVFMARIFHIKRSDGHSLKIALIDLICSSYEPYAALDGNILTTILFSSIVRIDMDTGLIVQYEECDNMGGLFEIHPIDGGYLIWGEGDIFRYDFSLNRVWHFMGRDILVSLHSDKHFWIEQETIHCRDFLGWHYVLNFDGKLIYDFSEFSDSETLQLHSDQNSGDHIRGRRNFYRVGIRKVGTSLQTGAKTAREAVFRPRKNP